MPVQAEIDVGVQQSPPPATGAVRSDTTDLGWLTACVVGINYSPETTGIAPYTTAMAQALRGAGAGVHVVTGVPHYPQWSVQQQRYVRGLRWEEEHAGVRVSRRRHAVPAHPGLRGRALMESSFLAQSAVAVRADRSDVVVAVTPSLSAAAGALVGSRGRPVGVVVQDLTGNGAVESGTTGCRAASLIGDAEYRVLRRADLVGVVTPQFAEVLERHGVQAHRIVELANFTHTRRVAVDQATARRHLGWCQDRTTIVHTGNMGMKQGLDTVVEAARIAEADGHAIDFVLVGDGNQRGRLMEQARGLPNVRFVDPLPEADYPYALAAADVLLLNERPGVAEMCMPSKLTSYCGADRPVLAASQPGGITHQVLDGSGAAHLVEPGCPAGLLAGVVDLVRSPAHRTGLTRAARLLHDEKYGAQAAHERYRSFVARLGALSPR